MPREHELFREQLGHLDMRFPQKEMLSIKKVAEFMERSREYLANPYKLQCGGISKMDLAAQICRKGERQ